MSERSTSELRPAPYICVCVCVFKQPRTSEPARRDNLIQVVFVVSTTYLTTLTVPSSQCCIPITSSNRCLHCNDSVSSEK